jgi:quercetin dioxygenase-like cupin family protein
MAVSSIATAEHYEWGDGCEGWHLVRTDELAVIEERMPAGATERRHRHERSRQFFYVLEGELTLEVEGEAHLLTPRTGLEIVPGAAHQALNHFGAEVRFLVISQPPSHGDRQETDES